MIRRFGQTPDSTRRYTLRRGAYAILPYRGGLLTTFQAGEFDEFQLPGGGVDPGESPLPALYREVMEETGWSITRPRRVGAFRRFTYMPEYDLWAEKLCEIFIASPTRCLGPAAEPHHRAALLSPENAAQALANEGDRFFVRQVFGLA